MNNPLKRKEVFPMNKEQQPEPDVRAFRQKKKKPDVRAQSNLRAAHTERDGTFLPRHAWCYEERESFILKEATS